MLHPTMWTHLPSTRACTEAAKGQQIRGGRDFRHPQARGWHGLVARRGSLAGHTSLRVALTEGPGRLHQILGDVERGNVF